MSKKIDSKSNEGIFKTYSKELIEKIFSSNKRLITIFGVFILPLIYAFICIGSFWNPLANLGVIPIAIVSQDRNPIKISSAANDTNCVNKTILGWSSEENNNDNYNYFPTSLNEPIDFINWMNNDKDHIKFIYYFDEINGTASVETTPAENITGVTINKNANKTEWFHNKWVNNELENVGLSIKDGYLTAKASNHMTFNKISWINENADSYATYDRENKWNVKSIDFYSQVDIPPQFSTIINIAETAGLTNPNVLEWCRNQLHQQVSVFSTYQKNFLIGEMITGFTPFIFSIMVDSAMFNEFNWTPAEMLGTQTPNKEFGIYGIGVGQMFICIGLWVGAFAMTTGLDKHIRSRNISAKKWYASKTLLMWTIGIIQTTILMLAIGIIGWFGIGLSFLLEYIFMLFCSMIFILIIQGIWFSFRDKNISTITIITCLVLNICFGGGTFPAILQNPYLNWIAYIMPFTYAINGESAIIYGISANFNVTQNLVYLLQMCGILLIYAVIFYSIGCYNAKRRMREIYYGSSNKYKLGNALIALKLKKYVLKNKHGKYYANWNALPKCKCEEIYIKTTTLHPMDKKFKWFNKYEIAKDEIAIEE
ncbi:MAG: hypothetical protein LBH55_01145 [Mycoplasmataceae bacterium]|nr:hypothetical protein [Mycoplasmataceae bacterium]